VNQAIDLNVSILRNKKTVREEFRSAAHVLTSLLAYEVLQKIPTQSFALDTPLVQTTGLRYTAPIMLVPILRSGITMVPSFLEYFPHASIGVVGAKRDEDTAQAHIYYSNLPPITPDTYAIVVDPMIATGGTGLATLALLITMGVKSNQIFYASMVSAPEGIAAISEKYPSVELIIAAQDSGLTAQKFITPGLGDFGDRYFGTIE
jgi:uracil phosphoribosyltransferase